MISPYNLNTMDAETLMYFFDTRMKKLLKDPKNFEYFNDEQMEILENRILPSVQTLLKETLEGVPGGHA
jgi:hypothetical protein|tara:strand:+ start:734 stop:940 length:207 start_codon:yes stop_codon:yes gene_type:complete